MGKRKEKKQAAREAKESKKARRGQQPEQKPVTKVDMRHNPLYPDRIENDAMGVLLAIVSVIVAIILLVVIVTHFSYASARRISSQTDSYGNTEEEQLTDTADGEDDADVSEEDVDPEDTTDAAEDAEPDLSDVDIDAVSDSYAEFTGVLMEDGDSFAVVCSGGYSIYAYTDSGEAEVMDNVNQIVLQENEAWNLAGYVGEEVSVGGYLEIRDQDMTMDLQTFEGPELEEDTAIHTYRIMIDDCTWSEAMQKAQDMGGYLVRINTQEEYDAVLEKLNEGDYSKYHFYLGGRRDSDGTDYYWVDEDNQFIGDCLNDSSSWCQSAWYDGEPSYVDVEVDVEEDAMNLFCVGGTWYLNDSSMDLAGNYPDYLGGKVGYIVEIEE
ncbi:MAG: C-type lectin domain-containing protein [Clostridiales bacterium]|nr:C-type lectin domain-containing protein [Clostridiales bacterium]